MPEAADMELRTIAGRELKIRWKSPRHGEWLAWCYVPGTDLLFNQGVGFEARAASPEEAREQLVSKVEEYLGRQ